MKALHLLIVYLIIILSSLNPIENNERNENKDAYIIPIHGEINKSMMVFIRRGVENAKKVKAKYVIFDIDTYGGLVNSALEISSIIGSYKEGVTIAYVTVSSESKGISFSAGAFISFSCNVIYMAQGTSMGAAAPVYQTSEGTQMAPEKEVSALRSKIAALAEKNGYPAYIAEAMVDKDIELIEIYINDKLYAVNSAELINIEREAKEKRQKIVKGKVIVGKDKLLTLTASEMEKYGVSKGTVNNTDDLYKMLNIDKNNILKIEESSTDNLVGFITNPIIIGLLVLIALVTLYIELTTPGFGVPGTISIICFAIVFGSNALMGRVGSLEIVIFLAGLILLLIELFIIPGFGATGVSGIILIIAALILSMQNFIIPKFNWEWSIFFKNILSVFLSFMGSIIFMIVLSRFLPKIKLFGQIALNTVQSASEGFTVQPEDIKKKYLGKKGVTKTVLRPSGKAEFDGEVIEVETIGDYLEKGTEVEIIEVSGNRIVVRKSK